MDVIYLMQETYKGMWKIFCNCLFSSIYARLGRELLFVQPPDHFLGHVLLKIFYHNNFMSHYCSLIFTKMVDALQELHAKQLIQIM